MAKQSYVLTIFIVLSNQEWCLCMRNVCIPFLLALWRLNVLHRHCFSSPAQVAVNGPSEEDLCPSESTEAQLHIQCNSEATDRESCYFLCLSHPP